MIRGRALEGSETDFSDGSNDSSWDDQEIADEAEDHIDVPSASPAGPLSAEMCATFDALVLIRLLGDVEPPGRLDVHTFAYLACLMSLFDGAPASDWGYAFTAAPPTLPYSPDLEAAISSLVTQGLVATVTMDLDADLAPTARRFAVSDGGRREAEFVQSLSMFAGRVPFLEAATGAGLLHSLPAVVNSLAQEPQLAQASKTQSVRKLLSGSSSAPLYSHLSALKRALGAETDDLVVPASMYVRFLEELARRTWLRERGDL